MNSKRHKQKSSYILICVVSLLCCWCEKKSDTNNTNNTKREANTNKTKKEIIRERVAQEMANTHAEREKEECRICFDNEHDARNPLGALACCKTPCLHQECMVDYLNSDGTNKTCPRCCKDISHLLPTT